MAKVKVCPGCGSENSEDAVKCSGCGNSLISVPAVEREELSAVSTASHAARLRVLGQANTCPGCGTALPADLQKCPICGSEAAAAPQGQACDPLPEARAREDGLSPSFPPSLEEAPIFPQPSLPQVIDGRYRILEQQPVLGGEADLYTCHDEQSGKKVVLKLYRVSVEPKEEVLERIRGLEKDDIIEVLDFGRWNGRFYEVTEFVEGGSLEELAPFSEEEIVSNILPQLLNGISYLHRNGIIHRDIKPANLFFRDREQRDVVIADFGISSLIRGEARLRFTTYGGTNVYMAPEAYTGDPSTREVILDRKADYYSLGITLMHLLAGTHPFAGMSEQGIFFTKMQDRVEPPEQASPRMRDLLRGLTCQRVEERWGEEELRRWLDGEEVPVPERRPAPGIAFRYTLREDLVAHTPEELGRLLFENREEAMDHFRKGLITEGIKVYDQALASRLMDVAKDTAYKSNEARLLGTIYALDASLPYRLLPDLEAGDPRELARLIDSSPKAWEAGREQLASGEVLAWLDATGYGEISRLWKERSSSYARNPDLALEAFLHLLDPSLPMPELQVEPASLEMNDLRPDRRYNRTIRISNASRGHLSGSAALIPHLPGVDLNPDGFYVNELLGKYYAEITVNFDTSASMRGETELVMAGNAPEKRVPISFRVRVSPLAYLGVMLAWLITICFFIIGYLYAANLAEKVLLTNYLADHGLSEIPKEAVVYITLVKIICLFFLFIALFIKPKQLITNIVASGIISFYVFNVCFSMLEKIVKQKFPLTDFVIGCIFFFWLGPLFYAIPAAIVFALSLPAKLLTEVLLPTSTRKKISFLCFH